MVYGTRTRNFSFSGGGVRRFYFNLVLDILGVFLIKQLFHSRL